MTIEEIEKIASDYLDNCESELDMLEVFAVAKEAIEQKQKTGHWMRMSNLSEQEDDRYKCSQCGNVIHHKNKLDLYTFNSWCGRCGSDNGRK